MLLDAVRRDRALGVVGGDDGDAHARRRVIEARERALFDRAVYNAANEGGTDDFEFAVQSTVAGLMVNPRPYHRFSDAMQDIVEVRILQGIHFRSADEEGRRQGARVAHWVFSKFLRPVPGS